MLYYGNGVIYISYSPEKSSLPSLTSKFLHRYFYLNYKPPPLRCTKINTWRSTTMLLFIVWTGCLHLLSSFRWLKHGSRFKSWLNHWDGLGIGLVNIAESATRLLCQFLLGYFKTWTLDSWTGLWTGPWTGPWTGLWTGVMMTITHFCWPWRVLRLRFTQWKGA